MLKIVAVFDTIQVIRNAVLSSLSLSLARGYERAFSRLTFGTLRTWTGVRYWGWNTQRELKKVFFAVAWSLFRPDNNVDCKRQPTHKKSFNTFRLELKLWTQRSQWSTELRVRSWAVVVVWVRSVLQLSAFIVLSHIFYCEVEDNKKWTIKITKRMVI